MSGKTQAGPLWCQASPGRPSQHDAVLQPGEHLHPTSSSLLSDQPSTQTSPHHILFPVPDIPGSPGRPCGAPQPPPSAPWTPRRPCTPHPRPSLPARLWVGFSTTSRARGSKTVQYNILSICGHWRMSPDDCQAMESSSCQVGSTTPDRRQPKLHKASLLANTEHCLPPMGS